MEDMIAVLKPVAGAIDIFLKNNSSLVECVFARKKLEMKVNEAPNNKNILSLCKARYEQFITDAHFDALFLSPSILVFSSKKDRRAKN